MLAKKIYTKIIYFSLILILVFQLLRLIGSNVNEARDFEKPLVQITFAHSGKDVQKQRINLRGSRLTVYPWKAVCDERADRMSKAVIVLVLNADPLNSLGDKISKVVKCVDPYGVRDFKYSRVFVPLDRQSRGFQLICPFKRNEPCPGEISLSDGTSQLTNLLPVETQLRKNCDLCASDYRKQNKNG